MARTLRWPSRRTLIVIAVGLVAVAAIVFGINRFTSARADEPQEQAETLTTATAELVTFEQSITASGSLTPAVSQTLTFDASGTVTRVFVEEGDTVKEGQKLARIDDAELELARLEAKADLLEARAALAEAKDADDGTDSSEAQIEARRAAVKVAKSAYNDARDAMSDAILVAPVDALITSVDIEVGDVISSGGQSSSSTSSSAPSTGTSSSSSTSTSGITIVGTQQWQVSTTVGASDLENIAVGNQVEMTADDIDHTIFGTVKEIGALPSTSSGAIAYPVTVEITGDTEGLYDGVTVDVEIIYSRRANVLAIPAAAVTTDQDASTVEVVGDDGTTTTTTVELGETSGNQVEITSGLTEGQSVQYEQFRPTGGSGTSGEGDQNESGFPGGDFQPPEGFSPPQGGGQGGGQGGPMGNAG